MSKTKTTRNASGFAHFFAVLLVLVIVGAIGFTGYKVLQHNIANAAGKTSQGMQMPTAKTATEVAALRTTVANDKTTLQKVNKATATAAQNVSSAQSELKTLQTGLQNASSKSIKQQYQTAILNQKTKVAALESKEASAQHDATVAAEAYQEDDAALAQAAGTGTNAKKCSYNSSMAASDPNCKPCPTNNSIAASNKSCKPSTPTGGGSNAGNSNSNKATSTGTVVAVESINAYCHSNPSDAACGGNGGPTAGESINAYCHSNPTDSACIATGTTGTTVASTASSVTITSINAYCHDNPGDAACSSATTTSSSGSSSITTTSINAFCHSNPTDPACVSAVATVPVNAPAPASTPTVAAIPITIITSATKLCGDNYTQASTLALSGYNNDSKSSLYTATETLAIDAADKKLCLVNASNGASASILKFMTESFNISYAGDPARTIATGSALYGNFASSVDPIYLDYSEWDSSSYQVNWNGSVGVSLATNGSAYVL